MDGTPESTDRKTAFEFAKLYVAGGISIIPIKLDGSKSPAVALWKPYQTRIATDDELRTWFLQSDHGIGVRCGAVSGGLEVIDFDDGSLFEPWRLLVPDIVAALTIVQTPSDGWHVIYRCSEIGGNCKIAMDPDREKKTLIETRGEGGYSDFFYSYTPVERWEALKRTERLERETFQSPIEPLMSGMQS
jgi:hypothetical protein